MIMSQEKLQKVSEQLTAITSDIESIIQEEGKPSNPLAELLKSADFKSILQDAVKQEVAAQLGSKPEPKPEPEQPEINPFHILHAVGFENKTPGSYSKEEKNKDWNIVYDNRPSQPEIVELDGQKWARNLYEKGKFGPRNSGCDFGGKVENAEDEVELSYKIKFEEGFEWPRGIKFPGLKMHPTMGAGNGLDPKDGGSTIRFQANNKGKLRWYVYHHEMKSIWGEWLGWDGFQLVPGKEYHIKLSIKLNTPDKSDGELKLFVNGNLENTQSGMKFRTKTSVQNINRLSVSTFMGGNDSTYVSPKTQYAYMNDFEVKTKKSTK